MDESKNLENPNLNNGNINNPDSNKNEMNQNNNFQNTPYTQNTEENPYFNPYFQNTNIDNSPYFDNSNVTLNNDIYNQSYMDASNSQFDNQIGNESNIQNAENLQDNQSNLSNSENQVQNTNEALNLFDLNENVNEQNEIENTNLNNNLDFQNLNTQDDTNFATTSNVRFNPILSQNINQSSFDQYQQLNNNESNYQSSELNNNQFIDSQAQDFNNNQLNNPSSNFVSNQFEDNFSNLNNEFMNETSNSYGSTNDEEFKKSWMGNLYDKANKRKFSIPSFFFGGIYYLYRKLYLFGFIFIILSCIIPIIGITMIGTNITNPSGLILPSLLTTLLPIILNIIYGFAFYPLYKNNINKKLNTYKNQVQSPNQLVDIANKKGGTSIGFVILGILLSSIVSTIILTTILTASLKNLLTGLLNNGSLNNTLNNNIINETENEQAFFDEYNFYNNYSFEYDSSKWTENEDNKLVNNTYTLSYIQSIENITNAGFDINQAQGRSSFFTYLYNLFSSQIDSNSTTLELGSSSFIYDNGIYYSYFDLVYQTSIERCYFVLIPEDDIFIEFILSNNDTVISDTINEEVVGYICSTTTINYQDNLDANSITNSFTNEIDNDISNKITSNVVNVNDSEPQSSMSNNTVNSNSNIMSQNSGLTITSNTIVNDVSVMYNTMQ